MTIPNETNSIDCLILLTLRMVGNLITPLEFGTLPLNDGGTAQATKKQPAHAGLLIFFYRAANLCLPTFVRLSAYKKCRLKTGST